MLVYCGLIMRTYPGNRLTQYVLVLGGGGRIRGHDDLARYGFALDLIIIYVRELDPALLLGGPAWHPWRSWAAAAPTTERRPSASPPS